MVWQAQVMGRRASGGVHVDRVRSRHTLQTGETREYESRLLRRSFRKPDGTVGKQTLANLSALPAAAVDAIEAVLKGKSLVDAEAELEVTRSLPHGHVALVAAQAAALGLENILGPPCRERGPGVRVDPVAGAATPAQVSDPGLVGRRHPGSGPGRGRGVA